MRTVLWSLVNDLVPEVEGRVIPAASADEHYEPPFIIIKSRGTFPSASKGKGGGMDGAEIWVHDFPGTYDRINRILKALREKLKYSTPRAGQHGAVLADIDWESISPDLNDDGYGTIMKMLSVNMVGIDGEHPDPTLP